MSKPEIEVSPAAHAVADAMAAAVATGDRGTATATMGTITSHDMVVEVMVALSKEWVAWMGRGGLAWNIHLVRWETMGAAESSRAVEGAEALASAVVSYTVTKDREPISMAVRQASSTRQFAALLLLVDAVLYARARP